MSRLEVKDKTFTKTGDIKIKCTATIDTIYWRSNEESIQVLATQYLHIIYNYLHTIYTISTQYLHIIYTIYTQGAARERDDSYFGYDTSRFWNSGETSENTGKRWHGT